MAYPNDNFWYVTVTDGGIKKYLTINGWGSYFWTGTFPGVCMYKEDAKRLAAQNNAEAVFCKDGIAP